MHYPAFVSLFIQKNKGVFLLSPFLYAKNKQNINILFKKGLTKRRDEYTMG